MSVWLREKLGEWYIVIIVIVAAGVVAASYQAFAPDKQSPRPAAMQQVSQGDTMKVAGSEKYSSNTALAKPSETLHVQAMAQPSAPPRSTGQAAGTAPMSTPASPSHAHQMQNMAAASAESVTSGQASAPGVAVAGGDAAAGRQVFRKCQACHSIDPGKNMLGPSLAGIFGRKAGSEAAYNYSPAMKQASITWDAKTLDTYLADPAKTVPGNKMPFPGLKTDHDRKDVIAFLAASTGGSQAPAPTAQAAPQAQPAASQQTTPPASASQDQSGPVAVYIPDARYTLRSGIAEGRMVYIGVGGSIDGKANPVLTAAEGQVVQLTLINGEGAEHDIVFPDQDAKSPRVTGKGASTTIAFRAAKAGDFVYFCGVPGHRLAGMEGQFLVTPRPPPQTLVEADISREPNDLPPPIGKREPQTVRVDLLSVEVEGRLAEGTTFGYWTFNGKVPGPFIRVRVGDTVDVYLKNSAESSMIHSVDFHAATGPGGGAASLQVDPGQEKSMTWKALTPGL